MAAHQHGSDLGSAPADARPESTPPEAEPDSDRHLPTPDVKDHEPGLMWPLIGAAVVVVLLGAVVVVIGRRMGAPTAGILTATAATVVLGATALVALARTDSAGRGLATAGVVLGIAGTVAAASAVLAGAARSAESPSRPPAPPVSAAPTARPPASPGAAARTIYIDDVGTGECYQVGSTRTVTTVTLVACSAAHDRELFGRSVLPAGPFPGDRVVDSEADRRCRPLFASYVGRDVNSSVLSYTWTAPGRAAWEAGSRQVNCAIADPRGRRLSRTARDSDR